MKSDYSACVNSIHSQFNETGGYFNQVVFLVNQARFKTTTIITPELILRYKHILNMYVVCTCAYMCMLCNAGITYTEYYHQLFINSSYLVRHRV